MMEFRGEQETSLWCAVYAAHVGTDLPVMKPGRLPYAAEELADKAVEEYRRRLPHVEVDPYRGIPVGASEAPK